MNTLQVLATGTPASNPIEVTLGLYVGYIEIMQKKTELL